MATDDERCSDVVAGVAYSIYVRGVPLKDGWNVMPHQTEWRNLAGLVKDGVALTVPHVEPAGFEANDELVESLAPDQQLVHEARKWSD